MVSSPHAPALSFYLFIKYNEMDSTSGRWCPLLLPGSLFYRLFFCGKNSQSHSCRTMRALVPALPITVGLPLCDNTQYSNHCVTSPITSLYQKSARSAITLFDTMWTKCIRVWQVCDSSVSVDHQAITLPARMAGQHMLLYCCYLSTDNRPMTLWQSGL